MDILLGVLLLAVCLAALWFVGYRGILPPPYDKWAMAVAMALGTGGLWLLVRENPKVQEPEVKPDLPVFNPPVIEVPSQTEIDRVDQEAEDQDKALEEKHEEVAPDDRGTDNDRTGSALARLRRM